jgi:nucleoside-diphosphate-sugar epimerase
LRETIILTGANSFLGKNFYNLFKKRLVIKKVNTKKLLNNINVKNNLEKIFKKNKPKAVVHFAAYYSKTNFYKEKKISKKVNYDFSKLLFTLSKKYNVKYFVNTSTVYEFYKNVFNKNYHYVIYKKKFTNFLKKQKKIIKLQIYLDNTYGLNDNRDKLIPKLIKQIKKKKIKLYNSYAFLNFVFVDDISKFIYKKIALKDYKNEEIIIKSKKEFKLEKIIKALNIKNLNINYVDQPKISYYIDKSIEKVKIIYLNNNLIRWLKKNV